MEYKVIRIIGVILLAMGAALIILQLIAREKSVIGSIAGGATPITMGALLLGMSLMQENKKKASEDPPDTPK